MNVVAPSPFVLEMAARAPEGRGLDIACGRGRHSLALARGGRRVDAIDRAWDACRALRDVAAAERLPVAIACADALALRWPRGRYALIVQTLFLERALFPALIAALAPGGLLVVETFTREQLALGHPRTAAFTLAPNELLRLVEPLRVVAYHDGPLERNGETVFLAGIAAQAPSQ
ncbi:MAG: methyltransferase domain-containing protein [Candidatus Binatia bacterium]